MFIPVALKAPRYYMYICTEQTQRPLSATPIALEDIFSDYLHVSDYLHYMFRRNIYY
jgi:hypothetical protein